MSFSRARAELRIQPFCRHFELESTLLGDGSDRTGRRRRSGGELSANKHLPKPLWPLEWRPDA